MSARYSLNDLPAQLRDRIKVNPFTGCWEWQHARLKDGVPGWARYSSIKWGEGARSVHRVVYEILVGPVEPDLELDHVYAFGCRSKACCWPAHLEQVTGPENTARGKQANIVSGVALTVRRRIAYGQMGPRERKLVDAVWMLPSPEMAAAIDDIAARAAAQRAARAAMPRSLVTPLHAAELLGVTTDQLKKWRDASVGPQCLRLSARTWVYQRAALDAWIASQAATESDSA